MVKDILKRIEAPPLADHLGEELVRIGGRNPFGEPMLRFEWGGAETHFRGGRERFKYPIPGRKLKRLKGCVVIHPDGTADFYAAETDPICAPGDVVDLIYERLSAGVPRWFLAKWVPPDIIADGHDEHQYEWINGQRVALLGERPGRGSYRPTGIRIETPSGAYCEPTAQTLDVIAALHRRFEEQGGHRRLEADEAARLVQEQFDERARADEMVDAEFEDRHRDSLKFWRRRLTAQHPNEGSLAAHR